jgi:hypothetical protein
VKKLLLAGVAALSLLLAGAAVAGSCIEYAPAERALAVSRLYAL